MLLKIVCFDQDKIPQTCFFLTLKKLNHFVALQNMKNSYFLILIGFLLFSCKESGAPDTIVESDDTTTTQAIDSNYCNCTELIFDEPYNHFYRFERRDGYTGLCEEFHPNGELKLEKNFIDGKLHGKLIMYYNNGQIEEEKEFDMNFQTGEQITYTKKGEVKFHALYKRGQQTKVLVTRPDLPKTDPWDEAN